MNIDPGYLSYIIKDVQQLKEYEENISHIICQYARLNLWEYKDMHYRIYDMGYHMCADKKDIEYKDNKCCYCSFESWEDFINEDFYSYDYEIEGLLAWEWLNEHSEYCSSDMYNYLRDLKGNDYICHCLQENILREHNNDCCLIMRQRLEEVEYDGCYCYRNGNTLQLSFLQIHSSDITRPALIYAKIKVSKDDESDIRKFINKHTSERSINV